MCTCVCWVCWGEPPSSINREREKERGAFNDKTTTASSSSSIACTHPPRQAAVPPDEGGPLRVGHAGPVQDEISPFDLCGVCVGWGGGGLDSDSDGRKQRGMVIRTKVSSTRPPTNARMQVCIKQASKHTQALSHTFVFKPRLVRRREPPVERLARCQGDAPVGCGSIGVGVEHDYAQSLSSIHPIPKNNAHTQLMEPKP